MKDKPKVSRGQGILKVVRQHYPDITQVADAEADFVLTIKPEHVEAGRKRSTRGCPAALACLDANKDIRGAFIRKAYSVMVGKDHVARRYRNSPSLGVAIMIEDHNGKMPAGQYVLKAPTPGQRLGGSHVHPKTGPHARKSPYGGYRHLSTRPSWGDRTEKRARA